MLWSREEQGLLKPAFDSERAYFLSASHDVIALDKRTGLLLWRSPTEGVGSIPGENLVVASGVVVAPVGTLFGVDARTGERRWRLTLPSGDAIGYSYIATDGTAVFTGGPSGTAYAIEAATGGVRWVTALGPTDGTVRVLNPTTSNGLVYVGVRNVANPAQIRGSLVALSAETGDVVWRHDFVPIEPWQGSGCGGAAAIHSGAVIVSSDDGRVHALDELSGELRWTMPRRLTPEDPGSLVQFDQRYVAAVGSGLVATSSAGFVTGIDPATGDVRWGRELPNGGVLAPPSGDQDRVYVSHVAGQITAVSVTTGAVLWEYGAWTGSESGYTHPPSPDGERLLLSGYGRLEAIRR